MKRTTLLSMMLMVTAIFFGCRKNEYKTPDPTPKPPAGSVIDSNAMKYTVNGITDRLMEWTDSVTIPLNIAYISGNQEKLNLTVTGLPQNTTATFDLPSGIPTFASMLTLRTKSAPGGVYNLKLVSTTETDSVKAFGIKLTIKQEPIACSDSLIGKYNNVQSFPANSSVQTGETIATSTGTKNMLKLNNLFFSLGLQEDVDAIFDCNSNKLRLVEKIVSFGGLWYTLAGEGNYTATGMDIYIRIVNNGTTVYGFQSVLTRK
jgi:hypothetical protein